MTARSMALAAYRHVLRSTRIAFQGDAVTLAAARTRARRDFEKNRSISTSEASKHILMAEDVARILRENVVQGTQNDGTGNFRLNIHDHIERGDNESVKIPSGKANAPPAGGCCQTA